MYFCISVIVILAHAADNLKSFNHKIKYKKKIGPRNAHEKKILTHEILTRKNSGPARKFWTHEIPTRKKFRPTKYPREKILDPLNTHEGTVAQWH